MSDSADGLEAKWRAVEDEVEMIKGFDGETPVDPVIKPVVVGLRAFGINTVDSCEGHVESVPSPYVLVEAEGREDPFPSFRSQIAWIDKNLEMQEWAVWLLERFYLGRSPEYRVRLQVNCDLDWGSFALRNAGGDVNRMQAESARLAQLQAFHGELEAFGEFLRRTFFSQLTPLPSGPWVSAGIYYE